MPSGAFPILLQFNLFNYISIINIPSHPIYVLFALCLREYLLNIVNLAKCYYYSVA